METQELKSIVEALIFAADEPLSEARIRETLELENGFDFNVLIDTLNQEYQDSGRSFTIRKIAGGYQIVTQQSYSNWIKKLYLGRQKNRLSHAALETLALIAFKQPISRVDIGQIRGVNSDGVIGTLLERKLVTISGRSEAVGRPLLYSTTPEFLKYFGINDITDLPKPREIEELFSKEGMPEELLQALSQTDAQLSLPINADGENALPDEAENKDKIPAAPINREPAATVEPPAEIAETPVSESAAEPAIEPGSGATETVALAPEISGVDINEKVVTQLEATSDEAAESLIAARVLESENEIAWISLNSAVDPAVEEAANHALVADDFNETANELPTFAGVTEVAQEQTAEQVAGDEGASEELAETANDLPTFAGVAEVAAEPLAEPPATNEYPLETLAETANELPTFANVDEVVSHTFAADDKNDSAAESAIKLAALESMTEEIAADFANTDAVTSDHDEVAESYVAGVDEVVALVAESPTMEVQVIEAYDVGLTAIESPPTSQNNVAVEIDGWMADDLSQEEIAEPDFIKKSGDFFLEAEPRPAMNQTAAVNEDEPTVLAETEPLVVSNTELSPIANDAFFSFDEATAETLNMAETTDAAEINETAPEPHVEVAVVDFPEPTIIASVPEPPTQVIADTAADEKLELIDFDAMSAAAPHEKPVATAAPSVTAELTTAAQRWHDDEIESLNASVAVAQPKVVSEAVAENEFATSPVIAIPAAEPVALTGIKSESSTTASLASKHVPEIKASAEPAAMDADAPPEDNDNRASTLRARVVGWFKRTFNKLLALIGATGENE